MKYCPLAIRTVLAAMTAVTVYVGAPCSIARAQNNSNANGAAASPVQIQALPHGVGEVVKMYQAGINKDIIINYINATSLPYHLNADGIIYLQTLGVPQEITKAILLRDGQLQQQQPYANQQYYQPQPMPGAYGAGAMQQQTVQVMAPSSPAPAVQGMGADYAGYDYGYPYDGYAYDGYPYYGYPGYGYYGSPYYYGPALAIGGFGWGRGGGYGGFRGGAVGFRGGGGGFRAGGGFATFHGGGGRASVGGGGRASAGGGHGGGHR